LKTIHKATVPLHEADDAVALTLPQDAKILSVGRQNNDLCFWYETSPPQGTHQRLFRIAGTGHPLGDNLGRFLGTVLFLDDGLVFHVYEIKEARK
jgi:hypothetical protein